MRDWSQEIQPESWRRLESGSVTRVMSSDRSRAYNRGHVFRSEWGIQPESRLPTEVRHTTKIEQMTRIVIYLHYKHA
jgi:hypothetical protein